MGQRKLQASVTTIVSGSFYRRLRGRLDKAQATAATAHMTPAFAPGASVARVMGGSSFCARETRAQCLGGLDRWGRYIPKWQARKPPFGRSIDDALEERLPSAVSGAKNTVVGDSGLDDHIVPMSFGRKCLLWAGNSTCVITRKSHLKTAPNRDIVCPLSAPVGNPCISFEMQISIYRERLCQQHS